MGNVHVRIIHSDVAYMRHIYGHAPVMTFIEAGLV